MYKQRPNGTFRLRASFPIDSARVIAMNDICNKLDVSFEKACKIAIDRLVDDFTQNKQVVIPEDMPQKGV